MALECHDGARVVWATVGGSNGTVFFSIPDVFCWEISCFCMGCASVYAAKESSLYLICIIFIH